MDRRDFLSTCGAAGLSLSALANAPVKQHGRVRLVDQFGQAIKAKSLKPNTNYLFHYPFVATPCFLLDLGRSLTVANTLKTQKGAQYAWQGGVGAKRSIVAYSAICAHKLAYPTREVSFIRFQAQASKDSMAGAIHCCADHSVYDPAKGAAVETGPAPEPLAAVVLEYAPKTDELTAVGMVGSEQFEAFFQKYDFKLGMEYGGRARNPADKTAVVSELTQYCRNIVNC